MNADSGKKKKKRKKKSWITNDTNRAGRETNCTNGEEEVGITDVTNGTNHTNKRPFFYHSREEKKETFLAADTRRFGKRKRRKGYETMDSTKSTEISSPYYSIAFSLVSVVIFMRRPS
jgi:hypothetical protein